MDRIIHVGFYEDSGKDAIVAIITQNGGGVLAQFDAIKLLQAKVSEELSFGLMCALDESPLVKFAEFDIAKKSKLASVSYTPSAMLYSSEQSAYEYMNAPKGWGITLGSSDEIIAIIDGGTDLGHPEFQGQIYDSIVLSSGVPQSGAYPSGQTHGTMTASIVAKGVNIQGMASGCKAYVIDAENPYMNITGAIDMLVQKKVAGTFTGRVISMSINSPSTYTTVTPVIADPSHQFKISGDATYMLNGRVHTIGNGWTPVFGTVSEATYVSGYTNVTVLWDTPFTGTINQVFIHSMTYEAAWEAAWNSGFIIFLAAGNEGQFVVNSLMSTHTTMVGASASDGTMMDYSNHGPVVKITAATANGDILACAPVSLPNDGNFANPPVTFVIGATELTLQNTSVSEEWYFKLIKGAGIPDGTIVMPDNVGTNKLRISKPTTAASVGWSYPEIHKSLYYEWGTGTSYATPQTAALAALIYSAVPSIPRADLLSSIMTTRQQVLPKDSQLGAGDVGCIDVYNAMHKALSKTQLIDLNLQITNKGSNGFSFSMDLVKWAHSYRVYVDGVRWPNITSDLSPSTLAQTITGLSPGDHTLTISMIAENTESVLSNPVTVAISAGDPPITSGPAPILASTWIDPLTIPAWTAPPTTPTISVSSDGVISMTGGTGAERVLYYFDTQYASPYVYYDDPIADLPWITADKMPFHTNRTGTYYFMVYVQNVFGTAMSNTVRRAVVYTPPPKVARKLRSPSGGKIRGKGAGKVSGKPQ